MVQAYVLVRTEVGRSDEVARQIPRWAASNSPWR